jgi:hypothetical protein
VLPSNTAMSITSDLKKPADLRKRLISFLESQSLYTPEDFPETELPANPTRLALSMGADRGPRVVEKFPCPSNLRIELPCVWCGGQRRTFAFCALAGTGAPATQAADEVLLDVYGSHAVHFRCTHCEHQPASFLIYVYRDPRKVCLTLYKAGQWPSGRPQPNTALLKALGSASPFYFKGLTAESHGFGIGAFAYYRRITEDIIDRLLDDLGGFISATGSTAFTEALESVKAEQQASKRIELVKELVPPFLRPGGLNPLGRLYGALSEGIHEMSDEQCLAVAKTLRAALEFLVQTMADYKASSARYQDAMHSLSQVRDKKAPPPPGPRAAVEDKVKAAGETDTDAMRDADGG